MADNEGKNHEESCHNECGGTMHMTRKQRFVKRLFDVSASLMGLVLLWPLRVVVALAVKVSSPGPVLFIQKRVGRGGRLFSCVKFRTMSPGSASGGSVTTATDRRVTPLGRLLRRYKLDELPQLFNVFVGTMSFVGPRPDVPGYADRLSGEDRIILMLRPGITGPATLYFRNEETLLASVDNPQRYNDEVIWPQKVVMNREYAMHWSLMRDIGLIVQTLGGGEG
jgi:lipopolysaccharide/colanic/teichoic acid biosynthesis glycosyltransferase